MILTCPSCASRYFVEDARLGERGRQVRCASCGAKWMAMPDAALETGASAASTANTAERADLYTDHSIARNFREKVQAKEKDREAAAVGAIWAGMAAALLVLGGAAVLFRGGVVSMWPKTAKAYASIGLPVNRVGLQIENVAVAPTLENGHAGLMVTGSLRNVTGKTVTSPDIEIKLTNPAGKTVAGKLAAPADPKIPAGQVRRFAVTLLDPPSTAQDLEVAFAMGAGGKAEKVKAPQAAPVAAPDLRPAAAPDPETPADPAIGAPAAVEPVTPAQ